MCGILGLFTNEKQKFDLLKEGIHDLHHRGPDVQVVKKVNENLTMTHARLSIVDLNERSNQPMVDEETGNVIVYNGEIFNFKELKELLPNREFKTESDTEVLLYLLSDFNYSDVLAKCNGMFAFAFWNAKEATLSLGRDRFGQKPLFYSLKDGEFCFASEAKALKPFLPPLSVNHEATINYLFEITIGKNEQSFFNGIHQLKNGTVLNLKLDKHKKVVVESQTKYWHYPKKKLKLTYEEAVSKLRDLFEDAVSIRLSEEVPFAAMLSGGLDSSAVCSFAANKYPQKTITSISAIYPGDKKDESKYAEMVTNKYKNLSPIWVDDIDNDRYKTVINDVIYHLECPLADGSIIAQHILMQEISKKGIKVILSGNGGDEVLAGYSGIYRPAKEIEDLKSGKIRLGKRVMYHLLPDNLKNLIYKKKQLSTNILSDRTKLDLLWNRFNNYGADDLLNNYLINGLEHWTLPNLMWYEDRNSMAASIESRCPFLDFRLVEFLLRLPASFKMNKQFTKLLLRDAGIGILPDGVKDRIDKQGFHAPNDQWVKDIDSSFLNDEEFRSEFYYLNFETIKTSPFRIYWRVYTLYLWFKMFISKQSLTQSETLV